MDYPADAPFFVRVSLMIPKPGMEGQVLELHRNLVAWLKGQPGFVRGYVITGGDPEGRIGHLNVYRSEHDADHVAQSQHVLSVRSELLPLIDEDSHAERSWTVYDPQLAETLAP
jgi:quinol monooxygenase YgiN